MVSINRDLALAGKTDTGALVRSELPGADTGTHAPNSPPSSFRAARVLDLGCGKMSFGVSCLTHAFTGVAIWSRGMRRQSSATSTRDSSPPRPQRTPTSSSCSGSWNTSAMRRRSSHLRSSNCDVVLSYCATDLTSVDRASLGG